MELHFCLILPAISIFAERIREDSGLMATVTKELNTTLPDHFQWIRVGSRSVELGWDAIGLANLHADQIKLSAYFYSTSVIYKYKAVPILSEKLTLDGLEPSTLYEVVVQALKGDSEAYKYTGYIKTLAPGEDGAERTSGFALIFIIAGLLLLF
ncbi:Oncosphere antigen B [Echinococcus granulosus]|uniref:Oncosphere antigen B n=1 Tax=Echinococcus granulosus TaxID=6210 RepID=W6U1E1_ECHGR|nr:Oncosphere antigen B [Echinococcus granulosus]EUB54863.1 Oncosphere antigen B [Echinococcus granulosus]KAH9278862.1 Oncosphere antigen B [Echinococcus granulosus]